MNVKMEDNDTLAYFIASIFKNYGTLYYRQNNVKYKIFTHDGLLRLWFRDENYLIKCTISSFETNPKFSEININLRKNNSINKNIVIDNSTALLYITDVIEKLHQQKEQ